MSALSPIGTHGCTCLVTEPPSDGIRYDCPHHAGMWMMPSAAAACAINLGIVVDTMCKLLALSRNDLDDCDAQVAVILLKLLDTVRAHETKLRDAIEGVVTPKEEEA